MQTPFVMSLLCVAVVISGCSTSSANRVDLGTVESSTAYNDRLLDSIGSQRYVEQQMLYENKVATFEHQIEELEQKRRSLESAIGVSQIEAAQGGLMASDDEALRMSDYASATHATQARLAKESGSFAIQRSLIENERDRKLMQAELEANRRLSALANNTGPEFTTPQDRLAAEKNRAEAARHKAIIESDTERELRQIDARFDSQIKQEQSESDELVALRNRQRMLAVIANADAGRRVTEEIEEVEQEMSELKGEKAKSISAFNTEIAKLNEQIRTIEGQISSTEMEFDTRIEVAGNRLSRLTTEALGLQEVGEGLIASSSTSGTNYSIANKDHSIQTIRDQHNAERERVIASQAEKLKQVEADLEGQLASVARPGAKSFATESEIRLELASTKTDITNTARSMLAELEMRSEMAKANVVAPVVTSRAVYSGSYGEQTEVYAARTDSRNQAPAQAIAQTPPKTTTVAIRPAAASIAAPAATVLKPETSAIEPIRVLSSFQPNHQQSNRSDVESSVVSVGTVAGGQVQPLVIAPRGTTYNVVYRYAEKGSADKFMAFLKAYGVDDFTYQYSDSLNEHILFMGKFTDKEKAVSRVAFLNKTTNTSNARILENDI